MNASELKNEVQKGLRAYKAFEHGEKVLLALESLEQTEKETAARVKALKSEETLWADKKAAAEAAVDAAKAEAQKIVKEANQKAFDLVANELNKITANKDAAAAELAAADEALAQKREQLELAQDTLAGLEGAIKEAKGDLKLLNDQKAEILAKFGK